MDEVRIKVLKEIPLDINLQQIENERVFNSVFLWCDSIEVFIDTVDTTEELMKIIQPDGIKDIYYNYLSEEEQLCFAKAFKETGGIYTFNDEKFSMKELMEF